MGAGMATGLREAKHPVTFLASPYGHPPGTPSIPYW
jgi:hypothetical protein